MRLAEDGPQPLLDRLDAAAEVQRVDLREERGDLERHVDARQLAPGGLVDGGVGAPAARLRGEPLEQLEVAPLVGDGLLLAHRGLAQHVEGEAHAPAPQVAQRRHRVARVAADDEALREGEHLAPDEGRRQR